MVNNLTNHKRLIIKKIPLLLLTIIGSVLIINSYSYADREVVTESEYYHWYNSSYKEKCSSIADDKYKTCSERYCEALRPTEWYFYKGRDGKTYQVDKDQVRMAMNAETQCRFWVDQEYGPDGPNPSDPDDPSDPDPSPGNPPSGGPSASVSETALLDPPPDQDGIMWLLKLAIKILSGLVGAVAVVMFIFAGVSYAAAGDSAEKVQKAKDMMRNTVIGILLYLFMFAILNFIIPGGVFK